MALTTRLALAAGVLAALASAVVAPVQAQASPVPAPSAARAAACTDGAFWPDGDDAHWLYHCGGGVGYRKECPAGLFYASGLESCVWPDSGHYTTRLTAGRTLRAHLAVGDDASDGTVPVQNATLTFRDAAGAVLCTARTDSGGDASCDAARAVPGTAYSVSYAGNGMALPSSANGTVEAAADS